MSSKMAYSPKMAGNMVTALLLAALIGGCNKPAEKKTQAEPTAAKQPAPNPAPDPVQGETPNPVVVATPPTQPSAEPGQAAAPSQPAQPAEPTPAPSFECGKACAASFKCASRATPGAYAGQNALRACVMACDAQVSAKSPGGMKRFEAMQTCATHECGPAYTKCVVSAARPAAPAPTPAVAK